MRLHKRAVRRLDLRPHDAELAGLTVRQLFHRRMHAVEARLRAERTVPSRPVREKIIKRNSGEVSSGAVGRQRACTTLPPPSASAASTAPTRLETSAKRELWSCCSTSSSASAHLRSSASCDCRAPLSCACTTHQMCRCGERRGVRYARAGQGRAGQGRAGANSASVHAAFERLLGPRAARRERR